MSTPHDLRELDGEHVRIFGVERGVVDADGPREPVVGDGVLVVIPALFGDDEDDLDGYYALPDDDV